MHHSPSYQRVRVGQIVDRPEAAVRREFGAERILPAEPVRPG